MRLKVVVMSPSGDAVVTGLMPVIITDESSLEEQALAAGLAAGPVKSGRYYSSAIEEGELFLVWRFTLGRALLARQFTWVNAEPM